jgi:PBP1b-binding outer membrane lipoprotein LpoB
MKKLAFLVLVCASAFLFNSCSDSDSDSTQNSTSFVVDGVTYDLPATQGIVNVVSPNAIEVNGSMYNRNTFIINGH